MGVAKTMRAVVRNAYGGPEVLRVSDVEVPDIAGLDVLVRVAAVSLNRADWYTLTGLYVARLQTGLRKPKSPQLGFDFAGTVEAIGPDVSEFRPGDEVFGSHSKAFAEYVAVTVGEQVGMALKPAGLSFEDAAAVPMAAITALQGLRDKGNLQPGQRVLVNGASGGVGTFAVQIAKALGAQVTAVCSSGNVEMAGSIGADHVIDYTSADFTRGKERYDLIFDVAGTRPWSHSKRVLTPNGTLVLVGGPSHRVFGPLGHVARVRLAAMPSHRKTAVFIAHVNQSDLDVLRQLLEAGTVWPVVERRYQLEDMADALGYVGRGHAQGKIVVSL
jgi:NADPH:quinone reductase-like Zn-dependent oxidoreductase